MTRESVTSEQDQLRETCERRLGEAGIPKADVIITYTNYPPLGQIERCRASFAAVDEEFAGVVLPLNAIDRECGHIIITRPGDTSLAMLNGGAAECLRLLYVNHLKKVVSRGSRARISLHAIGILY